MKKVIFSLFILQVVVCANPVRHWEFDHQQRKADKAKIDNLTKKPFETASYCASDRSLLEEPKRIQCNALDQIEGNRKALRLLAGLDRKQHDKNSVQSKEMI